MADLYDVMLAVDLRADLTPAEVAELRWHVGQGERPEQLTMGTDNYLDTFPVGDPDDPDCEWTTAEPEPVFAVKGPAHRVGGALVGALVERVQPAGWALTVRQELHPDQFYQLRALLVWLGPRATHDGFVGYLRFYENRAPTPLTVDSGQIALPDEVGENTPLWQ